LRAEVEVGADAVVEESVGEGRAKAWVAFQPVQRVGTTTSGARFAQASRVSPLTKATPVVATGSTFETLAFGGSAPCDWMDRQPSGTVGHHSHGERRLVGVLPVHAADRTSGARQRRDSNQQAPLAIARRRGGARGG
jgi:hypothetical protein